MASSVQTKSSLSKSAKVRAQLKHPVIDSDGHTVEFQPALREYIAKIGGLNGIRAQLNAVVNVVDSADRTPPAQAYALFDQASRDLAAQLAAWTSLKTGKLVELNRAFQAKHLPQIEIK